MSSWTESQNVQFQGNERNKTTNGEQKQQRMFIEFITGASASGTVLQLFHQTRENKKPLLGLYNSLKKTSVKSPWCDQGNKAILSLA